MDLSRVTGWMSPEEKTKFLTDLKQHSQFKGQSEFIQCAAKALADAGKKKLAQPLRFLTEEERARLAFYDEMERRSELRAAEPSPTYGAKKSGKKKAG
jgi:tellurite resistance protein